jgi:hypothetical protein
LIAYLQQNKKSRRQILDMMAQNKRDEFEKSIDKEVKKGIDDQDTSDIYHSDDDSLMQEY